MKHYLIQYKIKGKIIEEKPGTIQYSEHCANIKRIAFDNNVSTAQVDVIAIEIAGKLCESNNY